MSSALAVSALARPAVDVDRLAKGLAGISGGQHVLVGGEAVAPFAKDETHGLAPMPPDAVVFPASSQEVRDILALCTSMAVPVTPRGAGSGRSGGCVAAHGGVVMSMTRMARIVEIHPGDGVAVVQPGVVLGDLQAAVEEQGLFYPPDPASLSWCTVGGTVAENAGGPRAVKYGVTKEYVLGMTAVLPTGEVLKLGRRAMKGVSGYDLAALMVGSEGTLAVITELTLKLIPRPRCVETALAIFPSADAAARAVTAVFQAGIQPRTLEYMDEMTINAVRPLSSYRYPDGAKAALIMETDGDSQEAVFAQLVRAADVATSFGATQVLVAQDEAQRKSIWDSRHLLSQATRRIKGQKVSEDIVVPRSRVADMVACIQEIGDRNRLMTCAFGHSGDGNLHVQVLYDDAVRERAQIDACMFEVSEAAIKMGGCVSGEHGVGLAKRHLLPLEQAPDVIGLQKRLKKLFDPANILNPGKIFL